MPALALAARLRERGHETTLVTEGRPVEDSLLARSGVEAESLHLGGRGPTLVWRVLRATRDARRLLEEHRIDLVLGTGGKTSVPVALAAKTLSLPVCLLEQNATTGRCNRLLAPFARRIYLGLPQARPDRRALMTGTPLRPGIGGISREEARRMLTLAPDAPTVLVVGGSQGAQTLNELVPRALTRVGSSLQVLHLSGNGQDEAVKLRYGQGRGSGFVAHVRPLVKDMAPWYAAADLVICRGGGCTIAELMAAGRPAIVVPYPHHKDRQQYWNGLVLERGGAGIVIEQKDLREDGLRDLVASWLERRDDLAAMGAAARALAPVDPCTTILDDLKVVAALN